MRTMTLAGRRQSDSGPSAVSGNARRAFSENVLNNTTHSGFMSLHDTTHDANESTPWNMDCDGGKDDVMSGVGEGENGGVNREVMTNQWGNNVITDLVRYCWRNEQISIFSLSK